MGDVGQGQQSLMGEEMSTSDFGVLSVHEWCYGDIPNRAGICMLGDGRVWTIAHKVSCLSPQDSAFLQVFSWLLADACFFCPFQSPKDEENTEVTGKEGVGDHSSESQITAPWDLGGSAPHLRTIQPCLMGSHLTTSQPPPTHFP